MYCEICAKLFDFDFPIGLTTNGACECCHVEGLVCKKQYEAPIWMFDGEWAFLSNFYASPIKVGATQWPTAEHLFQAKKTKIFSEKLRIFVQESPGKAKRLGRKVTLRPDWEQAKFDEMFKVVLAKFPPHSVMAKRLLATGQKKIVEGNHWHDNTWGHCFCEKCRGNVGYNALGKILMSTRNMLAIYEDFANSFNQVAQIINCEKL